MDLLRLAYKYIVLVAVLRNDSIGTANELRCDLIEVKSRVTGSENKLMDMEENNVVWNVIEKRGGFN